MGRKEREKQKEQVHTTGKAKTIWFFTLAPAFIAILLYANTFSHGYVLDDVSAITQNTVVQQGLDGVSTIWKTDYRYGYWSEEGSLYRPLALTLFAWEWHLWPNNPKPAHIINVLLFAICSILLFQLTYRWFGRKDPWLPLFVTLLFTVHPIHTEVVANIKSADELLAFVFAGLSLLALWNHVERSTRFFSLWMIVAMACFFLALTSKESVITLIPLVPLSIYFFTGKPLKQNLVISAGLIVPFLAYMALRTSVLGSASGQDTVVMVDNILVEAQGVERLATAIKLSGMYLWKMIFPHPLSHDYSYNQIPLSGFADPFAWLSLAAYGFMTWFAIKKLKGKHPLSFAILFFLLTFSLYSNVVMLIGTHFGERLLFLPSVGFCMAIGWLLWKWGARPGTFQLKSALLPGVVLGATLIAYSGKTLSRNADWASETALYEADIKNCPNSSRTHYRLGMAYMKEKALKTQNQDEKNAWLRKALAELQAAVHIYPGYADAQGELGLAYHRLGMRDDAIKHYRIALDLNPAHYTTMNNMGTVLFESGRFEKAIPYFEKALQIHPRYKDAAGNLASAHGTLGHYDEAIRWFKKAIELAPGEASYYYFLGITYNNKGDLVEGHKWLEKSYQMDPKLRPKQ